MRSHITIKVYLQGTTKEARVNDMKKMWRRVSKKLSGKMLLVEIALVLFVYLTILETAGVSGTYQYVDLATLVYMIVFTVLILVFTEKGKHFFNGMRIAFSKKCEGVSRMELEKAITSMKFIKNVVFLEAGITVTICFVDLLYHMDDPAHLGPPLAVSALSFFYASVFALFIMFMMGKLESMVVAYMGESDEEEAVEDSQTVYFKLRALGLTDREAEVARLVSCEMTNKEIGQLLYISDTTVKKHITHILEKTGLEDREKLSEMIKGL